MQTKYLILFIIIISISIISCDDSEEGPTSPPAAIKFENPREVTIVGYTGDTMEPFISRDGSILFFNNLNSGTLPNGNENDTDIHYALRIDDVTFQYKGKVIGASGDEVPGTNELEGVPNMDKNNKFYFIRTTDYFDQSSPNYLLSIFRGDFNNGALTNIESLPNLKNNRPANQPPIPGELNFDAEISYDGNIFYFAEGIFSGKPFPDESNFGVAENINGIWRVKANSSEEFAAINSDALEYAASISTDMLELYFTRAEGSLETGFDFGVFVATRSAVTDVWSNVSKIEAISGIITEAPSISFNGKLLYYHQRISDVFKIYVVERE